MRGMNTRTSRAGVLAAGIALLTGAVAAGCSSPDDTDARDAATPVAVRAARVAVADVSDTFEAGGVVQARTTATLTARILAPVREVRVAPGDRVRAGQVVIVLDGRDLNAQARSAAAAAEAAERRASAAAEEERAAQASLALARATHERIAGLEARRSATRQELDEATAALRAAEAGAAGSAARVQEAAAGVESARAASEAAGATESFTRITSPFDGVVTEKMVEPGNMASPGTPLLRVEDTRAFRLDVRVDESRIGSVAPGAAVEVILDSGAGDARVAGAVSEIARAVEADSRAFLVKVALPDTTGIRSGMFGRARFAGAPRKALTVPEEAVVRRGQVTSVFVIDRDVARLRLVSLRGTEVLAGLSDGDVVIVKPPPDVADGTPVRQGGD